MGGRGLEKEGQEAVHECWATEMLVLPKVPPGLSSSPVTGSSLVEGTSCRQGPPSAAPPSPSCAKGEGENQYEEVEDNSVVGSGFLPPALQSPPAPSLQRGNSYSNDSATVEGWEKLR